MDEEIIKSTEEKTPESEESEAAVPEEENISVDGSEEKEEVSCEKKPKRNFPEPVRLITTLTCICLVIALLLAVVNAITKDKIEDNIVAEKSKIISAIFPDSTSSEKYEDTEDGSEIFLVYHEDKIEGYSVYVRTDGFGGDMYSMIGIDSDYSTKGVGIVSLSETPGVGTKVNTNSYLSLYSGKPHDNPLEGVDAISGASISSKALRSGIEKAHSYEVDLERIAKEKGTELFHGRQTEESEIESADITETEADTESDTVTSGTDIPESSTGPESATEDIEFVDNRPNNDYQYVIEGTTGKPSYELEISKDAETETFDIPVEPTVTEPEPVIVEPVTPKQTEETGKTETTKKAEPTQGTESAKQPVESAEPVVSQTAPPPNTVEDTWTDFIGRNTEPDTETVPDSDEQN